MNTTTRSIALGVGVALVIIAGVFGYQYFLNASAGERYVNEEYGFSFAVPEGFEVREVENVVVIDNEAGEGVQVVMTPIGEDIQTLTEERIKSDLPELVIRAPQTVRVGEGRSGLAFKSDNPVFDGASSEIWFVYPKCSQGVCQNYLYQIATYERLDSLLLSVVGTWDLDIHR